MIFQNNKIYNMQIPLIPISTTKFISWILTPATFFFLGYYLMSGQHSKNQSHQHKNSFRNTSTAITKLLLPCLRNPQKEFKALSSKSSVNRILVSKYTLQSFVAFHNILFKSAYKLVDLKHVNKLVATLKFYIHFHMDLKTGILISIPQFIILIYELLFSIDIS